MIPARLAPALAAVLLAAPALAQGAAPAPAAAPQPVPASPAAPVTERQLSLGLAQEIAGATIEQCRRDGYRVTVAVVDRAGQLKALMREDGTSPHTLSTAQRKAYTSLALRATTADLAGRAASAPGLPGLRDIEGVIFLAGGVPVRAGGEVIGAVGVGGAPSGDRDEACAQAALARVADRLR